MRKKRLWFFLGAIALLTPTIILCVLFATSDDGVTLRDFVASERFIVRSTEGKESVLQKNTDEYRLLSGFLSIAAESESTSSASDVRVWHYTVSAPGKKAVLKMGILDGMCVIGWDERAYFLDYPLLSMGGRTIFPGIVRYGLKTDMGYLDAPKMEQNTAIIYCTDSIDDLRRMTCGNDSDQVKIRILLYEAGKDKEAIHFENAEEIAFDSSLSYHVFVNVEYAAHGYRVQCSYEIRYTPSEN